MACRALSQRRKSIAGVVSVVAEINPLAAEKRHAQGWVDELHYNLDELISAVNKAVERSSRGVYGICRKRGRPMGTSCKR